MRLQEHSTQLSPGITSLRLSPGPTAGPAPEATSSTPRHRLDGWNSDLSLKAAGEHLGVTTSHLQPRQAPREEPQREPVLLRPLHHPLTYRKGMKGEQLGVPTWPAFH